jgi:hypothetical protein
MITIQVKRMKDIHATFFTNLHEFKATLAIITSVVHPKLILKKFYIRK